MTHDTKRSGQQEKEMRVEQKGAPNTASGDDPVVARYWEAQKHMVSAVRASAMPDVFTYNALRAALNELTDATQDLFGLDEPNHSRSNDAEEVSRMAEAVGPARPNPSGAQTREDSGDAAPQREPRPVGDPDRPRVDVARAEGWLLATKGAIGDLLSDNGEISAPYAAAVRAAQDIVQTMLDAVKRLNAEVRRG